MCLFRSVQTSSRPNQVGASFSSRRGHSNKLSISDPSHHVTEAIGTLYDDEDDDSPLEQPHRPQLGGRPLSFMQSPYTEQISRTLPTSEETRPPLERSTSDNTGFLSPTSAANPALKKTQTMPTRIPNRLSTSFDSSNMAPISPTLSLKDVQADPATSQFPLTNIDNPNDIAQELSNLQALRRMSMDVVNNNDPDLLPFSSMSLMAMPSIAPSGGDDEADPSRLLWVPARVHPELAPMEFKSFLENRVQSIKRRSGSESTLSTDDGLARSNSAGLRRKKSMLSRQIDPSGGMGGAGYVDGAERLGRQRSQTGGSTPELTIDELVKDPTKVVQKLTQESMQDAGPDTNVEDMPILPIAPGGGLRRSTRTTYRKGGSLRGDKLPFSKRIASRQAEAEAAGDNAQLPAPSAPAGHGLSRTQSEPVSENYSRPNRSLRRQQNILQDSISAPSTPADATPPLTKDAHSNRTFQVDRAAAVPQIVETPPEENTANTQRFPQRSSSQKAGAQLLPQTQPQHEPTIPEEPPVKSSKRQAGARQAQAATQSPSQHAPSKTLTPAAVDMGPNSSHVVADGRSNRTDALTYIPTYSGEEKKKNRRERDDDASSTTSSKSSWKWFKGDDKKKKDDDHKKSKTKAFVERAQDNVRLDVIQTSIENAVTKGRESLLLDREAVDTKIEEEKKKQSNRKSDSKKEKDGGLFSNLFGGSKKKSEKESSKKGHARRVSEEPPYRPLRPDMDYPWTRFPLLEERAIYRMAHIKLANPRRSLHSQVLLSNFMYNYLAIVQGMHPQMQIPVSPQQRRLEEERRRKEQEKQYLSEQQQQQQIQGGQDSIDRYTFDYHRDANQAQYSEAHAADESVDYMDDTHIYDYDDEGDPNDPTNHGSGYSGHDDYGRHQQQGGKDYYSYGNQHNGDDGRRGDMW
ncbi:hypothetical protein jhhlp_003200 [Lomentospora prolificans]|uniref:Protein Zds1 C-terminal domain-containing protein n=1 Tax=Lomentospora prolificans TaxID=41688 RepID=A0A2N3NGA6_9PEZI|nr:hypothetical protein jhhlp_003200 [Lomentospora prolificans]